MNDVLSIMYTPTPENPKNKTNMHIINAIAIVLSLIVCGRYVYVLYNRCIMVSNQG